MKKCVLNIILLATILTISACGPKKNTPSEESSVSSSEVSQDVTSENSEETSSEASSEEISSELSSEEISSEINSENSSESSDNIFSSEENSGMGGEIIKEKLETPVVTINEEGEVTWNPVDGATGYNYIINGNQSYSTIETSLCLIDKQNVSIQAYSEDNYSDYSKAVSYYDTSDIIVKQEKEVKVYFHNANMSSITVTTGQTISRPSDPVKVNHTFDDWYKDPFFREKFDFSEPITGRTVVYANYIKTDLINNAYYWIKASPLISSSIISNTTSSTGWRYIPFRVNHGQTGYKEFMATIKVNGASSTNPAAFIIMDGFDSEQGRTFWKNNGNDFTITNDGTYDIYFSLEHQYSSNVHAYIAQVTNKGIMSSLRYSDSYDLVVPTISINNIDNTASWNEDSNALGYEVVINNEDIQFINSNSISLPQGSHISVRTVYDDEVKSNWSEPKANIKVIVEDDSPKYAYAYFSESGLDSISYPIGSQIESAPTLENTSISIFKGWTLKGSSTLVIFPYTINENTVFYPKWEYASDIYTKDYYYLVNSSNTVVDGLIWNYDNYDFYEYELKEIQLSSGTYYIKSLDKMTTYETFTISSSGKYSIYFSEDNVWTNQGSTRHVYVAEVIEEKVIYFTNSRDSWKGKDVYAYVWKSSSGSTMSSWPGTLMTYSHTNSMGENIYKITVDLSKYDSIIFSVEDGTSRQQTVDISLSGVSTNAYYVSGGKDGSGKYPVGTWNYSA